MTSFDINNHLLPPYSEVVALRDLGGLIKAHFRKSAVKFKLKFNRLSHLDLLPELSFSELDQAFIGWGLIAITIFAIAQFSTLSWTTQSLLDAALTGIGIASTSKLTWRLACSERLRWVIFWWAGLMAGGMALTAYSIFCGVGVVLMNLCPLWLGLCSVGYLVMGIGLRSRCFSAASVVHGLAIALLPLHPGWQFLISGLVMTVTLFFFSVFPWDMRADEAEELCGLRKDTHSSVSPPVDSTLKQPT